MNKVLLSSVLTALLLVACNSSPSQNPPDETRVPTNIDSFDAFPNPVNIGTQFTWTVFGSNLRCTIDADSNGTIDYTVDNCTSSSRVNHVYPTNGQYIATLYLSGADGLTDQELAIVKVLEANRSPNIVQLRHQPVTSNPLSLAFGWSVDDADQHITQCQLDADSDGQIDFNDLCSKLGHTYTFAKRGKYTALLRACDPYSCVERKLPVRVPYNTPPVINSLKGVAGSDRVGEVSFVVSDADDDTLQCKLQVATIGTFTFNNCTEALRSYKFAGDGSYPVTLKVSDGLAEVSKSVTIKFGGGGGGSFDPEPPLPPLPICDYGSPTEQAADYYKDDIVAVGWFSNDRVVRLIGDSEYRFAYHDPATITSEIDYEELYVDTIDPIPTSMAISPAASINDRSTHLAVGSVDGSISFFFFKGADDLKELEGDNSPYVRPGAGYFPEGFSVVVGWSALGLLVGGTGDPSSTELKLWDVSNIGNFDDDSVATEIPADYLDNPVASLPHAGGVTAVAFSRGGTRLATAAGVDSNATIKIWKVTTSGATLVKTIPQADDVMSVAWSPDGTKLAVADDSYNISVWDIPSGTQVGSSVSHNAVKSVSFSPNGTVLASGGYNSAKLWSWNGASLTQLGSDLVRSGISVSAPINSLAFSPDGQRLATGEGSADEEMTIWGFSCTGP